MESNMLEQAGNGVGIMPQNGGNSGEAAINMLKKQLAQVGRQLAEAIRERDEARIRCAVKDRALWLWVCPTEELGSALNQCTEMGLPRELNSATVHALSTACALPVLAGAGGPGVT